MINIITQLLDWIYQKKCYFCHKPSESGLMCMECYEKIDLNIIEPVRIINSVEIYSASLYIDNVKKLIRGLKYHRKQELAQYLAKIMYNYWQNLKISAEDFEIVPMPLHSARQKNRGYNHVILLAEEFSKLTGYSFNTDITERIKNTKPLYSLTRRERMENLHGAFKVNPQKYSGKKLLLMDDICTTGASFQELINAFKRNNINDLYALVGATPVGSMKIL